MVIVIVTDFLAFVLMHTQKNESQEHQLFGREFWRKIGVYVYTFLYVKKLLIRKCEIQILMLHPDSLHVSSREEEEKRTNAYLDETLREKLIRTFNSRLNLQRDYPSLKIKLYKMSPLCSMTVLDDRIMKVTPYLYQVLGLKSPTFEIENLETDLCIFDSYEKHFDNMWIEAEERLEPFSRTNIIQKK